VSNSLSQASSSSTGIPTSCTLVRRGLLRKGAQFRARPGPWTWLSKGIDHL
jgi:hypothetical protein